MRKSRPSQAGEQEGAPVLREPRMGPQPLATKRPKTRNQRRRTRQRHLEAGLAVIAGRTVGVLSRRLHLGGGTSIVGIVAQRVYPDIVEHLATQLEHGSIIVTGTNGKTTTSNFIASIMRHAGLYVWNNKEGSNLMRGVAAALVTHALPNGQMRRTAEAISILEVDEAALPQVVRAIPPRVLVITNLFRDQLDRYGEVDSILQYWQQAIKQLPETSTLVLNADDPAIANLGIGFQGHILYYGIDDLSLNLLSQQDQTAVHHQTLDTRMCPACGNAYVYDVQFYSHMGHYHCPTCDTRRPQPEVSAKHIQLDTFDSWHVQLEKAGEAHELTVPLPGLYNVYNALAAVTAAQALAVGWEPTSTAIEQAVPVFGRGERIEAEGRSIRLLLAKNPTGFNEVLRTLFTEEVSRHILFVLNDNTADGHDISWIWDVDFERAVGHTTTVTVAGTRAADLALRLKYAGLPQEQITIVPSAPLRALRQQIIQARKARRARRTGKLSTKQAAQLQPATPYGLKQALSVALQQTPVGETLFVVPTYTALLEIHRELGQRGLTTNYWEGKKV
ncbi:MAG TPA: MurT ligase domain-containing protein [Ktedonobacteraceae bacterium]